MKELKLTQEKLAAAAGISQAALSAIINNKSEPKAETLRALAESLRLPLDSLAAVEEWQSWPQNFACPRCGSRAVSEFYNHADGAVRLSCGFCGLDTGEQKDRAGAMRLISSYAPPQSGAAGPQSVHVYALAELLDSSAFDGDDVRPVWFENQGLFCCPALLQYGIAERELELVRVQWWNSNGNKSFSLDKYGAWWRCWSQRPTEAQSLAVAWAV